MTPFVLAVLASLWAVYAVEVWWWRRSLVRQIDDSEWQRARRRLETR